MVPLWEQVFSVRGNMPGLLPCEPCQRFDSVELEAFLLRPQALRNWSRAICRPIRRARRRRASFRGTAVQGPRVASSRDHKFLVRPFHFRSSSKRHRVGIPIQRVPTSKGKTTRGYRTRIGGFRMQIGESQWRATSLPRIVVYQFQMTACAGPPMRAASAMRRGLARCPQRASESFRPASVPRPLAEVPAAGPREGTRSAYTPGPAKTGKGPRAIVRVKLARTLLRLGADSDWIAGWPIRRPMAADELPSLAATNYCSLAAACMTEAETTATGSGGASVGEETCACGGIKAGSLIVTTNPPLG